MKRIRLQNDINKIIMIYIFETPGPAIDSSIKGFHYIINDSSLSDIVILASIRKVLSEINIKNDVNNKIIFNNI